MPIPNLFIANSNGLQHFHDHPSSPPPQRRFQDAEIEDILLDEVISTTDNEYQPTWSVGKDVPILQQSLHVGEGEKYCH